MSAHEDHAESEVDTMRGLLLGALFSVILWAIVGGIVAAIGYGIAWAVTR